MRQLVSASEAYPARRLAPKRYVRHAKCESVLAKILRARPSGSIIPYGHSWETAPDTRVQSGVTDCEPRPATSGALG